MKGRERGGGWPEEKGLIRVRLGQRQRTSKRGEQSRRGARSGRGESIGESRESGLLRGGLTSTPLFLLLLFSKLYVWNLTPFLS